MNTWIMGPPTQPGTYLLQFDDGDRFVVVDARIDIVDGLVFEYHVKGARVSDRIHSHTRIPGNIPSIRAVANKMS